MNINRVTAVLAILVFTNTSVYAVADLVRDDAEMIRLRAQLKYDERRLAEGQRLIDEKERERATAEGTARKSAAALAAPRPREQAGLGTKSNVSRAKANDYFDLDSLSITCFMKDDRPVCSRHAPPAAGLVEPVSLD